MIRHFTASAVILDADRVLLVHHRKLGFWLYPGGHIEPNEDPAQTVRREVREEVGLDVEIISDRPFTHTAVTVVEPPFTILVEDIADREIGPHQHIDLVYVCRPLTSTGVGRAGEYDGRSQWIPLGKLDQLDTPPELPPLIEAAASYAAAVTPAR